MDPQVPDSPQKQRSRWPFSRRVTIIGAIVVIALAALLAILFLTKDDNSADKNQNDQAVYYDRPGYDRNKLGDGTADPFAVKFTSNATAITHKDKGVIQACNLLGPDEINEQDLLIKSNTLPTPMSRTINDGVGKANYNQDIYASSLSGGGISMGDVNNCKYVLQSDDGVPAINISVFQPFSVPGSVVTEELQENYKATKSVEGLKVYIKNQKSEVPGQTSTEYIVVQPGKNVFYISFDIDDATKREALLKTAVKNFIAEQSRPSGVSALEYDSPIFDKSIVRACELVTNGDIRKLTGRDAGPLAFEGIATAIANLRFTGSDDPANYVNVRNECERGTSGGGSTLSGGGDFSLKVETTSYLSDIPAKRWVQLQHETNPNNRENMELPETVGDGGVAYTDISGGGHIIFSKGRIVVDISVSKQTSHLAGIRNLTSAAEKLTPVAKEMADRIKL